MKSFLRFAVSLFVLCLIVFSFAYFFGPQTIRERFHNPENPVGQLGASHSLTSPEPPQHQH